MMKGRSIALTGVWILVLVAILIAAWLYLFKQTYPVRVEAACDPNVKVCFTRDCSSEGAECPPNNLETYQEFTLPAKDFKMCSDDSCAQECTTGKLRCTESVCSTADGDSCVGIGMPTGMY